MTEFEHLKIQLEEIKKATNSFSDSAIIGHGGFGKVYKGEVSHSKGRGMAAIKRLDRQFGQGDPEFWKEIMMLSRYSHKNIISLLGFCDEDGEKILVYELAYNGSLDRHLSSIDLTWAQRIKICFDVAKGLSYLHDHCGTKQRVIHRDIKSANILLDHNWNAKVADMGLSKLGPANQQYTSIYTNLVGTHGYCDPQYMLTYKLTKESDVYSFGVVLFEVLCGRLCSQKVSDREVQILVHMWKKSYKQKKLDEILFKDLLPPIDKTSLETFASIANQCVKESREQRPKISIVVKQLESAFRSQERYQMKLSKNNDDEENTWLKHFLQGFGQKLLFNFGQTSIRPPTQPLQTSSSTSGAGTSMEDEGNKLVFLDVAGNYSFDLKDLYEASTELLGRGSVGTSHKLVMYGGTTVVLKRLKDIIVSKKEFESRMEVLGKLRNKHLLPLRAFYYSEDEKLLVHDYLPARSLSARLHGNRGLGRTPLDWGHRLKIVLSAAKGVAYLHKIGNLVHGNIKSSNILLQQEAKKHALVSDFGLNTLFGTNHHDPDYEAPEVLLEYQKLTFKSDVYSFGVLLLELLTGKAPNQVGCDLPGWVQHKLQEEWEADVFDVEIVRHEDIKPEMIQLLKLAINCVSNSPAQRPSMNEVVRGIEDINQS